MRIRIWVNIATDPYVIQSSLIAHTNPTPQGNYRFWGAVRDLRPGEFWQVHGVAHEQAGPQLFAYDVGVAVESGSQYTRVLPNTDGTQNEHSRVWGKGSTPSPTARSSSFCNDFPATPARSRPDCNTRRRSPTSTTCGARSATATATSSPSRPATKPCCTRTCSRARSIQSFDTVARR